MRLTKQRQDLTMVHPYHEDPWTERVVMPALVGVSYLIWSIAAVYCLYKYNKKYEHDVMRFGYVSFTINVANALLGITEFYQEDIMYSLRVLLELLEMIVVVPCLTTEIWLKYEVGQKEMAWAHTAIGLVPAYIFIFQHYTRQDLIDFSILLDVASMVMVACLVRDGFVLMTAVMVSSAHYLLLHKHHFGTEMFSRQLLNYVLAVFTFCGYKSVMD